MPFEISSGCFPAEISDNQINRIIHTDTSPDMRVWKKIKEFFGHTQQPEALACIRTIYHPQPGTTQEDIFSRFEQIRMLAYSGYEENIQSGRHGSNHFSILDASNHEVLSVTFDDTGSYTVECEGNRNTHTIATKLTQAAETYDAIWSAWERAALPEEASSRATVVEKMRRCLHDSCTTLSLEHLFLTTLPDYLPPNLLELKIRRTELTHLPVLPPGLQKLKMTDTPLTSLPALPSRLQSLEVNNTLLTRLPALPSGIQRLEVNNTQLTSLPALPSGLQRLEVNNTPLTSLPALPSRLLKLYVTDTELTSLPESIASLSKQTDIYLRNNPLTERTLLALRNMTMDFDYSGPRIHFSMSRSSPYQKARPLHLAVAGWLAPANEGQQAPSDRWQSFGQQDNAASFSKFLDRLSETKNAKTDSAFKTQIATWLAHLACDDELRAKTFAMATEATSSCEDRVTLALNHMKNVQLGHRAEKGEFDNNHLGLVALGREMFRLEKLEQVAREKASTLRFIDEIEVYLSYQNKLKEPLELTSVTKEMRFFDTANVTESDLKCAEIQVKTAENTHFREWILQWAPLHSMLKRTNSALWQTFSEQKKSDYNDTYRMLSDTELKPAGLLDNDDAVRSIGARAMESAEKAFLKKLSHLVNRMLAGYLDKLN